MGVAGGAGGPPLAFSSAAPSEKHSFQDNGKGCEELTSCSSSVLQFSWKCEGSQRALGCWFDLGALSGGLGRGGSRSHLQPFQELEPVAQWGPQSCMGRGEGGPRLWRCWQEESGATKRGEGG